MKKHQKHTPLIRPFNGNYGRNEWTFIGAPCGLIHSFCQELIDDFSQFKIAFVDAAHQSDDQRKVKTNLNFVDNISHNSLEWEGEFDSFKAHTTFSEQDIVLVNGNHFKGKKQIVFIDARKKESLSRKMDRLDDIQLFILQEGEENIYDFLYEKYSEVPVLKINQTEEIKSFFKQEFEKTIPSISGLVLAGGQSLRMGQDKSQIKYHGLTQQNYLQTLLEQYFDQVYISLAQKNNKSKNEIEDTFTGLGPFGAILSAFREHTNSAFLVLACDLPSVDEKTIEYLIEKRDPSKLATAFLNPATNFADPLCTIWEPKAYMTMLQFLAQGYSCPRKVLINTDINLIELPNKSWLQNVNTREELNAFLNDRDS